MISKTINLKHIRYFSIYLYPKKSICLINWYVFFIALPFGEIISDRKGYSFRILSFAIIMISTFFFLFSTKFIIEFIFNTCKSCQLIFLFVNSVLIHTHVLLIPHCTWKKLLSRFLSIKFAINLHLFREYISFFE